MAIQDHVQAVLFEKNKWKTILCRSWLKKHKLKPIKRVHLTENYYRYRIVEPLAFSSFKTIKLGDEGIDIIIGFT